MTSNPLQSTKAKSTTGNPSLNLYFIIGVGAPILLVICVIISLPTYVLCHLAQSRSRRTSLEVVDQYSKDTANELALEEKPFMNESPYFPDQII